MTAGDRVRTIVSSSELRLSLRGRLVATVFLVPGVVAALLSLYLPNSDQGGVLSVSALTFYLGALVVLTGPSFAVRYALRLPSLRRIPEHPAWQQPRRDRGRTVVTGVGLALAGANALAALWFAMLADHAQVEQLTVALFALAAVTHIALTAATRR